MPMHKCLWCVTHSARHPMYQLRNLLVIITSFAIDGLPRWLSVKESRVWSLGLEDPLEEEMASHSSLLAWKIPCAKKPDRLQFMGWPRVRHDWVAEPAHAIDITIPIIKIKKKKKKSTQRLSQLPKISQLVALRFKPKTRDGLESWSLAVDPAACSSMGGEE